MNIWRTCSKRSETRILTYNWQLRLRIRWHVVLKVKNFWKTLYITMTKSLLKQKTTSKIQKHIWKICQTGKNTRASKKPSKTMNKKRKISYNKESWKNSIIWNANEIQQQRKNLNQLNIKQDFKNICNRWTR